MGVRSDSEGSDKLVDPLVDYSSFSLFSRSINTSNPSSSSIVESLKSHFNVRVLSSPDKMLKQAKTILEGGMDHLKTDNTKGVCAENEKVPRERRPALGFKRAKFSAKPLPSQPAVSLKSSVDFEKLSDPDKYFAAIERMENAEKEVQRLRGEPLMDLDQNRASVVRRCRRPSLLGRSATYTHRSYSSISSDVDETLLSLQETFDNDRLSPTHNDVPSDANVVVNSPSVRVSASKVSELDELLSSNYDGLDEVGVQNFLQDKLQIKLVDIGKASLPDWRVQLRKSLTSISALPKTNDTVHLSGTSKAARSRDQVSPAKSNSPLASISLLNRHIAKRTPSKDLFSHLHIDLSPAKATDLTREPEKRADQAGQYDEVDTRTNFCDLRRSPAHGEEIVRVINEDPFVLSKMNDTVFHQSGTRKAARGRDQVSPAKSKTPLASISSLSRHIAKRAPSKDPFSPLHIDLSPAKAKDLTREPEKRVGQVGQFDDVENLCDFRRSPAHAEEIITVSSEDPSVSAAMDVHPIGEPKEKEYVAGKSVQIGNMMDLCESGRSPGHEESIAVSVEDSHALASKDVIPTSEPDKQEDEMAAAQLPVRKLIFEGLNMENSSFNGVEKDGMGEPSNSGSTSVEEPTKHQEARSEAVVSEEPVKKGRPSGKSQSDVPVSRGKRRKVGQLGLSKDAQKSRFSLYCAGTEWQGGVRKSTRIRMRPLQYWKGERFLYGRVHESLVTVIGVKYASPSNDAEGGVKVKSFVSDEYKDLVELASLH